MPLYDPEELGIEKDIRMSHERALEELRMFDESINKNFWFNFKDNNRNETIYTRPTEAPINNPVNKIIVYVSFAEQSFPYVFSTFEHTEKTNS